MGSIGHKLSLFGRDSEAPEVEQDAPEAYTPYDSYANHIPAGFPPAEKHPEQPPIHLPGHAHMRDYPAKESDIKDRQPRWSTWALVSALLLGLLVAAAVGGGVGGELAHKNTQIAALRVLATSCTSAALSTRTSESLQATTMTVATATVTSLSTTISTTTSTVNTATPTADCTYPATGHNVTQGSTNLIYTIICNTDFDEGAQGESPHVRFYFTAYTMGDCLGWCDSYNYFEKGNNETSTIVMANWNWGADGSLCWCTYAADGYKVKSSSISHSAFLAGTFDASSIPGT